MAILLASCAPVQPLPLENPQLSQVWPSPPDKPRLKLLRVFSGAADLVESNTQKGRIYRWLTGDMAEQMPFVAPYGVATDGADKIWVADPGAHAVHAFDLESRRSSLLTLAGGEFLTSPVGLVYDPTHKRIYVSDSVTKKVVSFSADGDFISELTTSKPFLRPGGLAMDGHGVLLVADVLDGLVRRFSPDGKELPSLGSPTTPDGKFNRPTGLAVDGEGRVYVLDSLNFRVEVLSATGESLASIGQLGDHPGSLSRPRGIAVDSYGHIYIADAAFDNIQVFNRQGQLLLVFGAEGEYRLSMPAGMFADSSDRIFAVDSFNHRILIYQFLGDPR